MSDDDNICEQCGDDIPFDDPHYCGKCWNKVYLENLTAGREAGLKQALAAVESERERWSKICADEAVEACNEIIARIKGESSQSGGTVESVLSYLNKTGCEKEGGER